MKLLCLQYAMFLACDLLAGFVHVFSWLSGQLQAAWLFISRCRVT